MPLLTCCSQHLWQKLILQVLQYFRAGKHLIKINVVCKLYSYTPQEAHGKNRFVKWVLVQVTELWLVWQWFVVSFLTCCGDPQKECPLCVKLTLIKPLCCSAFIFCTAESSSLSASWVNTYYRLAIIKSISSRRHGCSFAVQPTATGSHLVINLVWRCIARPKSEGNQGPLVSLSALQARQMEAHRRT